MHKMYLNIMYEMYLDTLFTNTLIACDETEKLL